MDITDLYKDFGGTPGLILDIERERFEEERKVRELNWEKLGKGFFAWLAKRVNRELGEAIDRAWDILERYKGSTGSE